MDEKEQKVSIINAQLLSALVNIETAQSLLDKFNEALAKITPEGGEEE